MLRQGSEAEADALDQGTRGGRRQPFVEAGEGCFAAGTEGGTDRLAAQAVAGETLPKQRNGALVMIFRDEFVDRVAAHPEDAGRAVGMAEDGLGGDDSGEPAIGRGRHWARHYSAASAGCERPMPEAAIACFKRSISCAGSLTSGGRTIAGGRRPISASISFMRLCMSRNGGA